jgi:hypothetical protein
MYNYSFLGARDPVRFFTDKLKGGKLFAKLGEKVVIYM